MTIGERSNLAATRVAFILFVILLCGACLDLLFFTGVYASDDMGYVYAAHAVASGEKANWGLGQSRMAMVLPTALFMLITRGSAQGAALCFVLYHLLLIIFIYLLAAQVHDAHTGLFSAGIAAICPLFVLYASCILPDLLSAVCTVAALYVLLARQHTAPESPALPGRALAVGLLLGVSYMAKVTGLLALPVLMLISWRRSPNRWSLAGAAGPAAMLLGVAVAYGAQQLLHAWVFGDTPSRIALVTDAESRYLAKAAYEGLYPWDRLQTILRYCHREMGVMIYVLLGGALVYPFLRGRSWATWGLFAWLFAYLVWGTTNPTGYVPPSLKARYLIPPLAFACIHVGAILHRVTRSAWRCAGTSAIGRAGLWSLAVALLGAALANTAFFGNVYAGRLFMAPEVNGVAQAVDFALRNDSREIVISRWVNQRIGTLLLAGKHTSVHKPRVRTAYVESLLAGGGFLFVETDREQRMRDLQRATTRTLRESIESLRGKGYYGLDEEIALVMTGRSNRLRVRTIAVFNQHPTRLKAIQHMLGWSLGRYRRVSFGRAVYLREITAPAEEGSA